MRVTNLSVSVEMRRSDGNYGGDKAEAQLSAALEPTDSPELALLQLLGMARGQIEQDLKRSPSLQVRRALIREMRLCNRCGDPLPDEERSYMHPPCREAEDLEIAERRRKQEEDREERARQWAESNANAEERALVGVSSADDDDDDDDEARPL